MMKQTTQLVPGDRVRIAPKVTRTVASVAPMEGAVGMTGRPLFIVHYAEGQTPEWGGANSAADVSQWSTVNPEH